MGDATDDGRPLAGGANDGGAHDGGAHDGGAHDGGALEDLGSARVAPVPQRSPGTRRLRFLKAYRTTFIVIASYLWLQLLGRVFGRAYFDVRLSATHRRNATRIERTIVDLQGLFIKVGQLISIMTNFLPEEFRKPLETLQDQVPARPLREIRRRITAELGAEPDALFAQFDDVPLASASLGQVHRARLRDGSEVVVKVQHADIDEIVHIDLKTIWRIMVIVRWFVPITGLDIIYRQVREMIEAELDFVREAAFMQRIGQNLRPEERVVVPTVHEPMCTVRVLTSTYCEGTKISDIERIDAWGIDRTELAKRLVRAYCRMIFIDGLYHADPHPGNILIQRDGTIVLLDFGAVAELSPAMKQGIPDLLEAVIKRDTAGIYRALRAMGFIGQGREAEDASERIVEYFHRRFQDEVQLESLNLKDIKIDPQVGLENILDLRRQDISIRELTSAFQVPKDWVLLERTILLMSGLCTHLDPNMNPMQVIRPYLEEFVFGEDRDFTTLVMNAVKDTAMSALAVPEDVRRYLARAMRGEIEMRLRGFSDGANLLYAAGHQLVFALFAVTSAAFALVFHVRGELPAVQVSGSVSGFFVLVLLLSMFVARRHRRR
jgi:predicted unusual protein kinase regulating ubiquinone biosynthesis (AarF/ABC1/UbiB family)